MSHLQDTRHEWRQHFDHGRCKTPAHKSQFMCSVRCLHFDLCFRRSLSAPLAATAAQSSPSTPRRPHSIHAQRRIPRVVGSIPIGECPSPTEIQAQPRSMLQIHGGVVPMPQRGVMSDTSSLLSVLCRFLCKAFPYLGWREHLRV